MSLSERDCRDLWEAVELLENPSFLIELASKLGVPLEKLMNRLPGSASAMINRATHVALRRAMDLAAGSVSLSRPGADTTALHRRMVTVTGAAGGFFGLMGLSVELPVTTTLMLRSIAEIARSQGEDLTDPVARMECMKVFALGSPKASDDAAESGYYAIRAGLAQGVERFLQKGGGRFVGDLLAKIAARFEGTVLERVAASGVPILGAAGGAAINRLFINHFQKMARGHFTVRRLERAHGTGPVREAYDSLRTGGPCPPGPVIDVTPV
ncbi:MAG TPA: EcsC family protein [Acidobacteria bacterium]|nr:EcsC family protein [Acidobacteriota bacterium]